MNGTRNAAQRTFSWLDERFHLSPLIEFMRHKYVPVHRHTLWYYMGGVALFLFMVQVFTGILLVLYYQANENSAFESVRFIMTKVQFGWLIRSVHSWSANLMVFFVFVHMFSTFFTGAFRKPRELTWVSGFILLVLAWGSASPAISSRGTNSRSSPRRWAPTSWAPCPSSAVRPRSC